VVQALSRALIMDAQPDEAFTLIEQELESLRQVDAEHALRLEAELCATARMVPGWAERVSGRLTGAPDYRGQTPGERLMLACVAGELVCRGVDAAGAGALAMRAFGDGALLDVATAESPVFFWACAALMWSDRLGDALLQLDAAATDAQRRGSVVGAFQAAAWRAETNFRAGRLALAIADATMAIEMTTDRREAMITAVLAPAWLVLALLEQGRTDAAEAALGAAPPPELVGDHGVVVPLLFARGSLQMLRREPRAAAENFQRIGRILIRDRIPGPGMMPWRSAGALAQAALGDDGAARELMEEELELTRAFGAPRALGTALRAAVAIAEPTRRVTLASEAVEVLAASEARLQHAHALCDLGAALRRRGRRIDARGPLRESLELALACDATALVNRAQAELAASGERARRLRASGREALTPAELRVARLAADGLTNRDVAQSLFVTVKTVETQLGQAYMKLGIGSRLELSSALGARGAGEAAIPD
jgi:DNA-binding CsgD family transcriptional regulator